MKKPIRIGIIGLGGFAGSHHETVARLEERGLVRLVCACDPRAAAFGAQQEAWRFAQRGVSVFPDYKAMLQACHRDLDLVAVPTPTHLHAEMHEAATAYGLPAYLEKPPTLDFAELERMIRADQRARHASLVGFNFIGEKQRQALKERLRSGEFGAVRGATLVSLWPRPASYFRKSPWAGRLWLDGRVVLESCFGNALAHFVHNLLFWLGAPDLFSWAEIAAVRSELYRGHAVEGADTFFVEADTAAGATIRLALSHACSGPSVHRETVLCDKAELRYVVGRDIEVRWNDGRVERSPLEPFDALAANYIDYARYLRGEIQRPATTLADSRPFVMLNNLAYISSRRIAPLPPERVAVARDAQDQQEYLQVAGLAPAMEQFLAHGIWPGAGGWGHPGGEVATPADLGRLHDTLRAMAGFELSGVSK